MTNKIARSFKIVLEGGITWRSLNTGHVDVGMISKTGDGKKLMIETSYDGRDWVHKTFLHYHFHETGKILIKSNNKNTLITVYYKKI